MKIVLDSNVILSAFITSGLANRIFEDTCCFSIIYENKEDARLFSR